MKRDMALIRALLEHVENTCEGDWIDPPCLPHYTDRQIHYHISLCAQAGLVETQKTTGADSPYPRFAIRNLTWTGHEMLDSFRK